MQPHQRVTGYQSTWDTSFPLGFKGTNCMRLSSFLICQSSCIIFKLRFQTQKVCKWQELHVRQVARVPTHWPRLATAFRYYMRIMAVHTALVVRRSCHNRLDDMKA
jgi:hypothetical protein